MIFLNGCTQTPTENHNYEIQEAPRMGYPYIDGASPECKYLTEEQMQQKRLNPEKSITCGDN
jgi:hypothetical protein